MEKWRIYTLIASLVLAILSGISWYWIAEIYKLDKNGELNWILGIGLLLWILIAFIISIFAIILLFYPFFVAMEMGGSKAWRNYFVLFLILLCLPVTLFMLYPAIFIKMTYSWISLVAFGYGAIHSLFMFFKEKARGN